MRRNHELGEVQGPTRLDIYADGRIVEASNHRGFRAEVTFDDNPVVESVQSTPQRIDFITRNGGFKNVRFDHDAREMITVAEASRRHRKRDA